MFEVFKITRNTYDETVSPRLPFYARAIPEAIITNSLIIPYYLSKIFFYTRIVNVWNSLPNSVVDASTIVAVAPGSTMLNASASGRDADFPGSRGSGVSGT